MTSNLSFSSLDHRHERHASATEHAFVDTDTIRTTFALALSTMYRAEVPLYGDLINIVHAVNKQKDSSESPERLSLERHGAIRLGTSSELQTIRRIFALVGMYPIGYYDLSVAGLPMHATCFRPVDTDALDRNPFRVFTTVLRPELLHSTEARETALSLLSQRRIFTGELLSLLDTADRQGGHLTQSQAERFISEAMLTFGWRSVAAATHTQYELLKSEHPILADIACFRSAHINHLTPRILDISAAQVAMRNAGMAVKSSIEGPPERKCPILLRQTSFLALEEKIRFPIHDPQSVREEECAEGSHKARFGEIEERGAAVTPKGRRLYDELLDKAMVRQSALGVDVDEALAHTFQEYPDTWGELRQQGLVYFQYRCTGRPNHMPLKQFPRGQVDTVVELLISEGILEAVPITYEDFLPLSAAGIFQSNLHVNGKASGGAIKQGSRSLSDQEGFALALGCSILDSDDLYASAQRESLEKCAAELGLTDLL